MDETRDNLEIFTEKLAKSLKYSVGRNSLRLNLVEKLESGEVKVHLEKATFVIKEQEPKFMVEAVLRILDAEGYLKPFRVFGVSKAALDLMKNFTGSNKYPEEFLITKLPYRQMKVQLGKKVYFLNLQPKSYQRLIQYIDNLKDKTDFDFKDLINVLKRKELITILLSIKNFED